MKVFKLSWGIFSGLCSVLGLVVALSIGFKSASIIFGSIFLVVYIVCLLFDNFVIDKLKATYEEKKIGKFKGLWFSDNIIKELRRDFRHAQTVKIKVTRGSELFDTNNKGEIRTYLENLRDKATADREIRCSLLLIAPCYKLKHVRERHELRKDSCPKPEDFMDTWGDTIRALDAIQREKKNSHFHLEVRFYSGRHSKWRFYIFESQDRAIKTVLFSDYDAKRRSHGRELPMYKVLENDQNIGGFMERYFDEIWNSALTKEKFKQLVLEKNCERKYCEECDIAQISQQGCQLSVCPNGLCTYWEHCKAFVDAF